MPRTSERRRYIIDLEKCIDERVAYHRIIKEQEVDDYIYGSSSDDSDSSASDSDLEDLGMDYDVYLLHEYRRVTTNRYISPRIYRIREKKYDSLLNDNVQTNDREFLTMFRVDRESFWSILKLIDNHPLFISAPGKMQQAPVRCKLLVFLRYIGIQGNAASAKSIAGTFGISLESVVNYIEDVVTVIFSMRNKYVFWPDQDERVAISN